MEHTHPSPSTSQDPAWARPLAEASIREIRRLVAEVETRYDSGDFAAVVSSLTALERQQAPLMAHVTEMWVTAECGTAEPEIEPSPGLYL